MEHKSLELMHNAIQNTKQTTLRLLGILNMFQHSIYREDIPVVFEHVYNQRLDQEGILECNLEYLLDALAPFFRSKRSPFDGRKYFEATEAVVHSWVTIEDNDFIWDYKEEAKAENSRSTGRTLENMMHALHDIKGIAFLPVAEISARKLSFLLLQY